MSQERGKQGTAREAVSRDPEWWRQAVVYQIYPRSFADSNGDGVGDLAGVTSKVRYLASLGVDAVWLSPFYPSALADGGYDVDDYRDVDPTLGTLADFDAMVVGLHDAGIRVMVDIVPNHTSNRHAWFREALDSAPGSAARDRYIFRDGTGEGGQQPPSDWRSVFGGPAWEPVGDGQWYLHIFAREQPDLNWDNREVRDDFLATLRFWADRGVDGFRVDVAHGLAKDLREPLLPQAAFPEEPVPGGAHPLWDRDEVHEIYAEWRKVFNEYDPPRMAVAEAWVHTSRLSRYASSEGLGQAFNFDLLQAPWRPADLRRVIEEKPSGARDDESTPTWVLSNHDVVRHATRYGLPQTSDPRDVAESWLRSNGVTPRLDRALGLRRARAAALLVLALPGSAYLYQGEELGLHEVADLPDDVRQDPAFHRSGGSRRGRDGCRVPLPWASAGPSFGFGDSDPHLPQPDWFGPMSVDVQDGEPDSTLELYRRAVDLRHSLQGALTLTWVETGSDVVHFERPGGWHCVTNLGAEPVELPAGRLLLASERIADGKLAPDATAWVMASNTDGPGSLH
ncbi:MAG: glycoside hydrolase family 13 protein [Nocardioidaceae bacterium]